MKKSKENPVLFRNTNSVKGRKRIIHPGNSDLESLDYTRTILDKSLPETGIDTTGREAALICMSGRGEVVINSSRYTMKPFDTLFLPPGNSGVIKTDSTLDIVECSAGSDGSGEPVFIAFDRLKEDPDLTADLGFDACERKIHRLIDDNVPAKRLLVGLIFSKNGNWTSWTPHEHARTKEEIYLYFDMPAPAFGIQLVYEDLNNPDFLGAVHENDAVVIKKGYHPNVAIPGYPINFVWMMSTNDPSMERSWADVNTQPDFL